MKNNGKDNGKIQEYKKIIEEQKKKIKVEKRVIKKRKREKYNKSKFGKTLFGRFLGKIFFLFVDKNSYSFSELFATTIISLLLGFFACYSLITIFFGGRNFFKISHELGKFYDVYSVLLDNYNGKLAKDELIEEAIVGMVSSVGDVYTNYGDSKSTEDFEQLVSGTYEGIGCAIQKVEDGIKIIEIYEGSPSEKIGLKVDDVIKYVDDIKADEVTVNKLSNYIKTEANGKIKIVVLRNKEELTFTLERSKVELPSIVTKTFTKNDKKIGYIGISIFSSVTAKQFNSKLRELEDDNIEALIIDVRGNNGGYLSAVTDIVSKFVPKGKVLYQVQNGNKKKATKDKTAEKREYPLAVLANGASASASEILAAAVKETYGGYVVGETTYGKGTVQQVKKLSDGSMIKYTTENWLTPNGNWINEVGVEPTDKVELDSKYFTEHKDEDDNQLQKALDLVSK